MNDNIELFSNWKFRYNWRNYQASILNDLDSYLDDDNLHIVASPGSGKTTIGLEALKRIGNRTLVLSPSLNIRDQWIERVEDFSLTVGLSTSLQDPKTITCSTYQGLFSIYKRAKDDGKLDSVFSEIIDSEIKTVVLDEAHHLKKEWWKALTLLKSKIDKVKIVALTATPPFDVNGKEWSNYIDLCGEIDFEINVPELIKEGNISPHQDLLYFSELHENEQKAVDIIEDRYVNAIYNLTNNRNFRAFLTNHKWLTNYNKFRRDIEKEFSHFFSLLIVCHNQGIVIDEEIFYSIGISEFDLPELDNSILGNFIDYELSKRSGELTLYTKTNGDSGKELIHLIRKINKSVGKDIDRVINNGRGRLNSIIDIVTAESSSMGNYLRMVILTDYIKKEYLEEENIDKELGVVPIFNSIYNSPNSKIPMAILTGSLVALPINIIVNLGFNYSEIPDKPDYGLLESREAKDGVDIVGNLFDKGDIQLIIGTHSLLGEGWDTPVANTLILATNISSFVSINQFRGRVLRKSVRNAEKGSNIWHLVTVNRSNSKINYSNNLEKVKGRFELFAGLTLDESLHIEKGFKRLNFDESRISSDYIKAENSRFLTFSLERKNLGLLWNSSLNKLGDNFSFIPKIKYDPVVNKKKEGVVGASYLKLEDIVLSKFNSVLFTIPLIQIILMTISPFFIYGAIVSIILIVWFMIKVNNLNEFNNPAIYVSNIFAITSASLEDIGEINKSVDYHISIKSSNNSCSFSINGANRRGIERIFNCITEILEQKSLPRYLIAAKLGKKDVRYIPVPKIFAKHKRSANIFSSNFSDKFGKTSLIYTKGGNGGDSLIKALTQWKYNEKRKDIEKIWGIN